MRSLFGAMLAVAAIGLMPIAAQAANQNQEAAEKIVANLQNNGPKSTDFKVGVRYLNGTVWLKGHVHDSEQLNRAVNLIMHTQGVNVNKVLREDLTVGTVTAGATANTPSQLTAPYATINPLRGSDNGHRAQAVPSSFNNPRQVTPVSMNMAVPPPPVATSSAPEALPMPSAPTGVAGAPLPMNAGMVGGPAPMRCDQPTMPNYAWPSYASYPNYAAVTYPKQYSPTAWPYIGPYYPYPQVPLGWRKVSLEWDDGWWWLDFKDKPRTAWWR